MSMTLPVRSETREEHGLIEETRKSLQRAKDLLKILKSSDPVADNIDVRRAVKKSVKQVKKAIIEADNLAKEWIDRIELETDS
jgi:hypothetical protein